MPKNLIIHSAELNGDGFGDLVYLMHWLRLFDKYYKGGSTTASVIARERY